MISRDNVIDYFKEYEELMPKEVFERELKVPLNSRFVISIIGPRRAGKTYYLFSLLKKVNNGVYLNFEDPRLEEINYKEIEEVLRTYIEIYGKTPKYLFLDEIQNVKGWEKVIRQFHDLHKYKIFVTGSSSKLLSKEIATQLRGRSLSFMLFPLSFREFLGFKGVKIDKFITRDQKAKLKNLLREYIEYGGFPDVVREEEKIRILNEYSDLLLFRDFIERHKIRNIELARILQVFLMQNFSSEISIRSIYNKIRASGIKVSKDTIYDYINKLEDTMFFFFLKRFSNKVQIRESWPKKIYLCDTGISKVVRFSPDYGKLMENVVFIELMRKKNVIPSIKLYYYRDQEGEVDFVVKNGNRTKLIQVTYARDEIKRREIEFLIKVSKELKSRDLLVITWDYEGEEKVENKKIKFVPLWKWLLNLCNLS